jgi:hypothetical protein
MTLLPKSVPVPEVSEDEQDKLWALWERVSYPDDDFPETEPVPLDEAESNSVWDQLIDLGKQ